MKAKEYNVLEMAVEEGIRYGYNRAFKYEDTPSESKIKEEIYNGVLNSICEWFDFEDKNDE